MLTNRELASLIWIGIVILAVIAVPKMRRKVTPAARQIVHDALDGSVLSIFGLFILWCSLWSALSAELGFWNDALLKDTILIVLTVGFPLLFRSIHADSGTVIIRNIASETIAVSALVLFYVNLEPFPLWAELIIQLLVTVGFLWLLGVTGRASLKRAGSCISVVLVIAGLGVLTWATTQFVLTIGYRDLTQTTAELALSIWLPMIMFPFFYGVTFYLVAQRIAHRMRRLYKPPARRRVVVATVFGLRFRLRWARAFKPTYERAVGGSSMFREALVQMREFRAEFQRKEANAINRIMTLQVMAGEPGTDAEGAQLDRREFDGTKRAMEFLAVAQGLRFEGSGNTYWDDLTDFVLQPTDRWGLPSAHGITVETTENRLAWRAWRRLPNGWFLAVGGRDGNPGHYVYAAMTRPSSWPGSEPWADTASAPALPPDWEHVDHPVE